MIWQKSWFQKLSLLLYKTLTWLEIQIWFWNTRHWTHLGRKLLWKMDSMCPWTHQLWLGWGSLRNVGLVLKGKEGNSWASPVLLTCASGINAHSGIQASEWSSHLIEFSIMSSSQPLASHRYFRCHISPYKAELRDWASSFIASKYLK